jgi:hypothetical protein
VAVVVTVLGYDLGTQCGWARCEINDDGQQMWFAGELDLRSRRHEGGGMRFLRFRQQLKEQLAGTEGQTGIIVPKPVDLVVYEEVARHLGTAAAHIYGGLLAVLQAELEQREIPYEGVPVGTIKKHATGKGNAGKELMLEFAYANWPAGSGNSIDDITHNVADALWLTDYAVNEILYGVT